LLPQAADKISNDPHIFSNEILIDVIALQPTATAFGRIKDECDRDVERMAKTILDIVENSGKFQDPITKSGGILIGTVKEIGSDLLDHAEVKVGDKIATLVSLSLTPLKLHSIDHINLDTEQVYCNGEAILFESGIYTKIPDDLGQNLALAVMDVAGAPAQVAMRAKSGDTVVVIGAGKAGLLCLAEAKKRVAPNGTVVCLEYSAAQCEVVKQLGIADVILEVNGQEPLDTYNKYMIALDGQLADFTINTVNVPDTELSAILVTKDTGMIFFFSMSTDFVKASLGAEGVKKYLSMFIGNGYYPGHVDITFDIVRRNPKLRTYFENRYS
jgi:L-erythro-3,5-diaminohexanoate dehydrogenase